MPDTLNLTEEKVSNSLELIGTRKDLLKVTPTAQALKKKLVNGIL